LVKRFFYKNKGEGIQGQTYAIPTKDIGLNRMLLVDILYSVEKFINYAKENPNKIFLVTEIGCGLAGWEEKDIAPLFKKAEQVENIYLPESFWRYLGYLV
jgi:hypothetical protein